MPPRGQRSDGEGREQTIIALNEQPELPEQREGQGGPCTNREKNIQADAQKKINRETPPRVCPEEREGGPRWSLHQEQEPAIGKI